MNWLEIAGIVAPLIGLALGLLARKYATVSMVLQIIVRALESAKVTAANDARSGDAGTVHGVKAVTAAIGRVAEQEGVREELDKVVRKLGVNDAAVLGPALEALKGLSGK